MSSLAGCSEKPQTAEKQEENNYNARVPVTWANECFARVPIWREGSLALTSGDFDGDGDLDFIAGRS